MPFLPLFPHREMHLSYGCKPALGLHAVPTRSRRRGTTTYWRVASPHWGFMPFLRPLAAQQYLDDIVAIPHSGFMPFLLIRTCRGEPPLPRCNPALGLHAVPT